MKHWPGWFGMLAFVACGTVERPAIVPNDNRAAAGSVAGGRVTVALEARLARWRPAADSGPALEVAAFGEVGRAPSVPGPLIRVPVGARWS